MKSKIIEILIVIISLLALAALVGCKDEVEATEDYIYNIDSNTPSLILDLESGAISDDIVFVYDHNGITEEVIINVINNEIVCSQPPEKAIKIIYWTLNQIYIGKDVKDLPVRFAELNAK